MNGWVMLIIGLLAGWLVLPMLLGSGARRGG
jgi:hypothetical protein